MVAVLPEIGIESSGTSRPITVRDRSNNGLIALANLKTDTHRLELAETVDAGSSKIMGRGRTAVADAAYTVLTTDIYVGYTALTASRVVTVPVPTSGFVAGQTLSIADESGACSPARTITVIATGGTVPLAILSAPRQGVTLIWAGTSWSVVHSPSGVTFPIEEGGAARNLIDRSRDYIVLQDVCDASASASTDQVGVLKAVAMAKADPTRPILQVRRDFRVTNEILIDQPLLWRNVAYGATRAPLVGSKLVPQQAMRSVLNVTSDGVTLENLLFFNPVDVSQVLNFDAPQPNCAGGADAMIRVQKTNTDAEAIFRNIQGYGFPIGIHWIDGIRARIEGLRLQQCGVAISSLNNMLDSTIRDVSNEYGAALKTNINSALPTSGPNGGKQGIEGPLFDNIRCSQTVNPAFGYKKPGIWLRGGFAYRMRNLQPQQCYYSDAMLVDGTEFAILDCIIHGLYMDGQANSPSFSGLNVSGQVDSLQVYGGCINGFSGYGMVLQGASEALSVYRYLIMGMRCFNNDAGDLLAGNSQGTMIANTFGSLAGVFEQDTSEVEGYANFFQVAPQRKSAFSTWRQNKGPGAFIGFPANISKLFPGNEYIDTVGGVAGVVRAKV